MITSTLIALTVASIQPTIRTQSVTNDSDDPSVWVHPTDRSKSLVIGTNKHKSPTGAIVVFDLKGKKLQTIEGIDRPNNVDVEYGFLHNGKNIDIAVATERYQNRLRVFKIDPATRRLTDISGNTTVFAGETGDRSEPMGVALYKKPSSGVVEALVSPKTYGNYNYLARYRLVPNGELVDVKLMGRFGKFSGKGEIEAVAVDDKTGWVIYADELYGLRSFNLITGRQGPEYKANYKGDREGLAILNGTIYSSEQIAAKDGGSVVRILSFTAKGFVPKGTFSSGADSTDGLEVCAVPLGKSFPKGLLVVMNSKDKNFWMFDLRKVR